jgi:hypothetical protein
VPPCRTIYLSWDAAAWHIIEKAVFASGRDQPAANPKRLPNREGSVPLPAGAQSPNVIESVFSGMAKGIIHNSDYPSAEAAKDAIDQYFKERNDHFFRHPKRASAAGNGTLLAAPDN